MAIVNTNIRQSRLDLTVARKNQSQTLVFAAKKRYKNKAIRSLNGAPNSPKSSSWSPSPLFSLLSPPSLESSRLLASLSTNAVEPQAPLAPTTATTTPSGPTTAPRSPIRTEPVANTVLIGPAAGTLLVEKDGTPEVLGKTCHFCTFSPEYAHKTFLRSGPSRTPVATTPTATATSRSTVGPPTL
jgi:hypothetical protein